MSETKTREFTFLEEFEKEYKATETHELNCAVFTLWERCHDDA